MHNQLQVARNGITSSRLQPKVIHSFIWSLYSKNFQPRLTVWYICTKSILVLGFYHNVICTYSPCNSVTTFTTSGVSKRCNDNGTNSIVFPHESKVRGFIGNCWIIRAWCKLWYHSFKTKDNNKYSCSQFLQQHYQRFKNIIHCTCISII